MNEDQQPRASPNSFHPMGPLTNKLTNKPIKCSTCGCEWGIRDLLVPAGIDPYSVLDSRMMKLATINCGLCGRTLE